MEYVADTVALVRHFSGSGKLGQSAQRILRSADKGEATIAISVISLIEILYLSERGRISLKFGSFLADISGLSNYRIVDLDFEIVKRAELTAIAELHDRLIVATAQYLGAPLITSERL